MSAAMAGSEVAITVESMFSMNKATARMIGTTRINSNVKWGRVETRGRWKTCAYASAGTLTMPQTSYAFTILGIAEKAQSLSSFRTYVAPTIKTVSKRRKPAFEYR
jgi:hypothetical protein